MAHDVNEINRVIWPFYFTSAGTELGSTFNGIVPANSSVLSNVTITQEAPFVIVSAVKSVFKITDVGLPGATYDYLNPEDDTVEGAQGLSFSLVDSQSKRSYFNAPLKFDHVGGSQHPLFLPSTVMLLPNSNLEIEFQNESANDYAAFLTFFGYRIRMDNAQELLSLISE